MKAKLLVFIIFLLLMGCGIAPIYYNSAYYSEVYGVTVDETEEFLPAALIHTLDYSSRITQVQTPWFVGSAFLFICVIALLSLLFARSSDERNRLRNLVKERTASLEFESTLLNTVFDSVPDIIFCKDLNFRYMRINRSFEQQFGIDRNNVIGKTDNETLSIAQKAIEKAWREGDIKVLSERVPFKAEELVPAPDGSMRVYETIKTPLLQSDKVIGLIGIARDITKRKEEEDVIIQASRAKTAFIANMSHEIRTPMNSIVGFSELAMEGVAPKTKVYLDRITENAKWLLQIMEDILDVSKIESGKLELEKVPFNLKEVFTKCQNMILPKASEKGLKLFFYAEALEDGQLLLGDPVRLRQIFVNLASNAVKFTNVGMIRVTSYVEEKTSSSTTLYFEVRDSGIGMSQEQMDRIFEPFMQADTSITRRYGGTGLGLAITKNLIETMGGKLSVNSVQGLGSKFSFKLTFEILEAVKEEYGHISPLEVLDQPCFQASVLVCEDNAMNQMVIEEHLTRLGINVTIADNGLDGLNIIKEKANNGEPPFDLILMDIHMPVMDGLEAAERIIALDTGTPIVAMTANIMITDREIYQQRGMLNCIGKPFTSQELWACLLKYLKPIVRGGSYE